jgi:hypothetical protein
VDVFDEMNRLESVDAEAAYGRQQREGHTTAALHAVETRTNITKKSNGPEQLLAYCRRRKLGI